MKNIPACHLGHIENVRRRALLHTARLLAPALILIGAGCTRSQPDSAPKAAAPAALTAGATDCVAISKSLPYKFESANYWGHQLTWLKDQHDMQACARACVANPACKVASFSDSTVGGDWSNSCVLRDGVGERHPESAGICSWVKGATGP
jgi:PAN domain